ncbi:hypothetical protein SAY87_004000 [Trapa incisa]|uniref:ZCF37 n=1 Tax=Trapa incisa TaxID=236973 RepID=A0AAN7JPZ3_9MYRT|nr:hypothetical protein SAY87_004000 [Trapa incisa]
MLNSFICGSFHSEEEEDIDDQLRAIGAVGASIRSSTPRRKQAFCRTRNSNHSRNPYSNRGLDKFEALLADINEKKRKIFSKNDAGSISLVRFVPTSSNNLVPIVVKVKGSNSQPGSPPRTEEALEVDKSVTRSNSEGSHPHQSTATKQKDDSNNGEGCKKKISSYSSWNLLSRERWRKPSYYMSTAVILILVFLLLFGRSAAILCTTIGWYLIPIIKGGSLAMGEKTAISSRPEKKKELSRRSSEIKIVTVAKRSPDRSPPRQHGLQRSW